MKKRISQVELESGGLVLGHATGVTCGTATATTIEVRWAPVKGAVLYDLESAPTAEAIAAYPSVSVTTQLLSATVRDLAPGGAAPHWFKVRARYGGAA